MFTERIVQSPDFNIHQIFLYNCSGGNCPLKILLKFFIQLLTFCARPDIFMRRGRELGATGKEDQWKAWNWSCDLRANERPQKKLHPMAHTSIQTDIATLWLNRPSGAASVKTMDKTLTSNYVLAYPYGKRSIGSDIINLIISLS